VNPITAPILRYLALGAGIAGLIVAQQTWQTATELSGVDMSSLNPTQKAAALKMVREQDCNCGCTLKLAECRAKDPNCSYSRSLATAVVQQFQTGKTYEQAYAVLKELQKQGPVRARILEDPVQLSVAGDPSIGPATAKITIVEFSDFQCPYCAMSGPKAQAVAAQYPKDVRLVFKQFPLDFHSNAFVAAEASLAAHAQGKFWALHDKMFANFRQLTQPNILRWAEEAGLDMGKFKADLQAGKHKAMVEREVKEGMAAGVMGTPTFFINGKRYNGPFELETLKPILDAELKAVK
jgi:protein-disulfide isomerase